MTDRGTITAGEALLRRLKRLGVDYVFANGGTDFAPLIEGWARGGETALPVPLVMPHETAAVSMAHGYTLATGRAQAVILHTNVGLANAVMGAINAATEQIPMILCSGRTPVTETGRLGSRTTPINWGQEMRDQAALVRESVKWDAELRYPEQAAELADRAMAIARSSPRGPVYLSLPREALCAPVDAALADTPPTLSPATAAPDPADVEAAARLLAAARSPLIIAHRSGDTVAGFESLRAFAEAFAFPVVEFWPSRNSLDTESPMHAGFDPGEDLAAADVVLVLDALVPWVPARHAPPPGCKVIQAGADPLHQRVPVRGFRADVALTGSAAAVIRALGAALAPLLDGAGERIDRRREARAALHKARGDQREEAARHGAGTPMTPAWVSRCVAEAIGDEGIVVTELGADPAYMARTRPGTFFNHAVSGGLGWGLPAALGVQLADRRRLVAACVGDGSYIFANPTACHQIAEALDLPVLVVVFDNGQWNAVRRSTLDIFPDGHAAKANRMPVTSLAPMPDFRQTAAASRGWAERVEHGAELPGALERAIRVIRDERRQALLDVVVAPW